MSKEVTLTIKQEKAILFLLENKTIEEIASLLKVSRKTIYRWLQSEEFKRRFKQARQEVFNEALERLKLLSRQAIETLEDIIKNGTKEASRVTASKTVLELALKLKEVEELESRVEELERLLREGGIPNELKG